MINTIDFLLILHKNPIVGAHKHAIQHLGEAKRYAVRNNLSLI